MTLRTAVTAAIASLLYVSGIVVMAREVREALNLWSHEHRSPPFGPVRRAASVILPAALWPCLLTAAGCVHWIRRNRCPFGECAQWGWATPGAEGRARAVLSAYRCPHRQKRVTAVWSPDQPHSDIPRPSSCLSGFVAVCAASALGSVASIPIPNPGAGAVDIAIAVTTVLPLEILARQLISGRGSNSGR